MRKIIIILISLSQYLLCDVKVNAFFSNEKAGTEDIVDFIIKVEGDEPVETPHLSSNESFQIISGPSISTSVQIVNFNMKKTVEYRWKVNPKREGILTMPSIDLKIGKNIYKTNEAKIEVEKGSILKSQRRQIPSIFDEFFEEPRRSFKMEAEVKVQAISNKTECFVGEPVIISYVLLTQTSIQNISMTEPPVYDGFWIDNIEIPEKPEGKKVEIDGKQFISYVIKKDLLFPNSEGIKLIKEASFQIQAITSRDFFGFPQIENLLRKTLPIKINVKPLPPSNLSSFKGAVGKFEIYAKTDKIEVEEGEAFTFNLKLKGKGNFKNIGEIELPQIPLCKIYPPKVEEKIKPDIDGYEGFKNWEWVLVPEEKQNLKIPQISFAYFDPYKKSYIELKTPVLNVFVKKGKEKKEETVFFAKGKEIKEISKDIGYIIVDGKNLKKKEEKNNLFYYFLIIPIFINLSLFIFKKIISREPSEKKKFEKKAKNYFKIARKNLELKNEEEFVKNIEKGLKAIISGNEDLTIEELREKIVNLPEKERKDILNFITNLQDFRFNPLFKNKKNLEEIEKEGKIWLQRLKNL